MSRHRFRSQPTLQRSGEQGPSAMVGVLILALIGVGAGAWLGQLGRGPAPQAGTGYPATPMDEPMTVAAASPAAQVQPTTAAPQAIVLDEKSGSRGAPPPPVLGAKATKSIRPTHSRPPQLLAAVTPIRSQAGWEQQQQDYERARTAYDANERVAGYQWAQQNRIRIVRYCRVAAQRTPAFVDGCLNYLAARRTGGSAKPREPANDPSPGVG
jgi:hypothetical protein